VGASNVVVSTPALNNAQAEDGDLEEEEEEEEQEHDELLPLFPRLKLH